MSVLVQVIRAIIQFNNVGINYSDEISAITASVQSWLLSAHNDYIDTADVLANGSKSDVDAILALYANTSLS